MKTPAITGYKTVYEIAKACEVDANTASKWSKRPDFPAKVKGAWPQVEVLAYARKAMADYANQMKGNSSDLRSQHVLRKCKKLDEEIVIAQISRRQKEREDELLKIAHEAKRGEWYHVDQVREFARLVVSAFDESVEAVSMATRDPKAVAAVTVEFDRVRKALAKKVRAIA